MIRTIASTNIELKEKNLSTIPISKEIVRFLIISFRTSQLKLIFWPQFLQVLKNQNLDGHRKSSHHFIAGCLQDGHVRIFIEVYPLFSGRSKRSKCLLEILPF
jgi:hypothetical protein